MPETRNQALTDTIIAAANDTAVFPRPAVLQDQPFQIHSRDRHSSNGIKARLCDFDLTLVNAEPLYMGIYECAARQVFGIRYRGHTSEQFQRTYQAAFTQSEPTNEDRTALAVGRWQKSYQPAFGLPTAETNKQIIAITERLLRQQEHGHIADKLHTFCSHTLKGMSPEVLLHAVRGDVMELYLETAERAQVGGNSLGEGGIPVLRIMPDSDRRRDAIARLASKNAASFHNAGHPAYQLAKLYEEHLDTLAKVQVLMVPGALEIIEKSYRMGIQQAVVTSSTREVVEPLLRRFAIDTYFSAIVGAGDVPRHKPDPLPYLVGLERLNGDRGSNDQLQPQEVQALEDSVGGVLAGVRAGLSTVACVPHNRRARFMRHMVNRLRDPQNAPLAAELRGRSVVVVPSWKNLDPANTAE